MKDEINDYENALFEIKNYLLERLFEYKNCTNKKDINHLTFKLLILKLLDKIKELEEAIEDRTSEDLYKYTPEKGFRLVGDEVE